MMNELPLPVVFALVRVIYFHHPEIGMDFSIIAIIIQLIFLEGILSIDNASSRAWCHGHATFR